MTTAGKPARRRQAPLLGTLVLLVLLAGGAAWAVTTGHVLGGPAGPGAASRTSPLAAPGLPADPISSVISGGDFCRVARDTMAEQSAALDGSNGDLAALAQTAKTSNRKLAAAAPAELRDDFQVFIPISDALTDSFTGGRPMDARMVSEEFLTAVGNISTYAQTTCGMDVGPIATPGIGG